MMMTATDEQPYGDVDYADPGYQSDKQKRYPLDTEAHVRAAWSYINMSRNAQQYSADQLGSIKDRIISAAKKLSVEISDTETRAGEDLPQRGAPVEERAATLRNVDFGERILTVVAVPYEQPTSVEYRGEVWHEVFSRSAFNGFEPGKRRVPVSAVLRTPVVNHNGGHLVGKVTGAYPDQSDGLVLDMRISQTPAGDETLQLAHDDALSPSIGFAARAGDHKLDRRSMVRRVNRAFLDHVSLVPTPAYDGARVLAMRDGGAPVSARDLPPLVTPSVDDFYADPLMQWADERLGGK